MSNKLSFRALASMLREQFPGNNQTRDCSVVDSRVGNVRPAKVVFLYRDRFNRPSCEMVLASIHRIEEKWSNLVECTALFSGWPRPLEIVVFSVPKGLVRVGDVVCLQELRKHESESGKFRGTFRRIHQHSPNQVDEAS